MHARKQSLSQLPAIARIFALALVLTAIGLLGAAAPAAALDDIAVAGPAKASADGACPALTAIKYPFIECRKNEHGGIALSIPGQPAPPECNYRLPHGECAADTKVRRFRGSSWTWQSQQRQPDVIEEAD